MDPDLEEQKIRPNSGIMTVNVWLKIHGPETSLLEPISSFVQIFCCFAPKRFGSRSKRQKKGWTWMQIHSTGLRKSSSDLKRSGSLNTLNHCFFVIFHKKSNF